MARWKSEAVERSDEQQRAKTTKAWRSMSATMDRESHLTLSKKLFTPYFTTRAEGHGPEGLAIVQPDSFTSHGRSALSRSPRNRHPRRHRRASPVGPVIREALPPGL